MHFGFALDSSDIDLHGFFGAWILPPLYCGRNSIFN